MDISYEDINNKVKIGNKLTCINTYAEDKIAKAKYYKQLNEVLNMLRLVTHNILVLEIVKS